MYIHNFFTSVKLYKHKVKRESEDGILAANVLDIIRRTVYSLSQSG